MLHNIIFILYVYRYLYYCDDRWKIENRKKKYAFRINNNTIRVQLYRGTAVVRHFFPICRHFCIISNNVVAPASSKPHVEPSKSVSFLSLYIYMYLLVSTFPKRPSSKLQMSHALLLQSPFIAVTFA